MSKSYINQMTELWKDFPWQVIIILNILSPFIDQEDKCSTSFFAEYSLGIRGPAYPAWGLDYMNRVVRADGGVDGKGCVQLRIQKEISQVPVAPLERAFPVELFPFSLIVPPIKSEMEQLIVDHHRIIASNVNVDYIRRAELDSRREILISQEDFGTYFSNWAKNQNTEEEDV